VTRSCALAEAIAMNPVHAQAAVCANVRGEPRPVLCILMIMAALTPLLSSTHPLSSFIGLLEPGNQLLRGCRSRLEQPAPEVALA